jgi:hypothetical protein
VAEAGAEPKVRQANAACAKNSLRLQDKANDACANSYLRSQDNR